MKQSVFAFFCLLTAVSQAQPTDLASVLKQAKANRESLRAAQLELSAAQSLAKAQRAYPATELLVGYSSAPEMGATDQDLAISQPLDLFGKTRAQEQAAQANLLSAEAKYRKEVLAVQGEVVQAYLNASAALQLSEVSLAIEKLAVSLEQATRRKFEEGKVPEVQLTRASLELERTRQATEQRKSAAEVALKRLSAVIGATTSLGELSPTVAWPTVSSEGIAQRPDHLQLVAQRQQAKAAVRVAQAAKLPDFELLGLRSAWRNSDNQYALRLQVRVPLFDHRKAKEEVTAAQKSVEASELSLNDIRALSRKELEALDLEVSSAQSRVKRFETIAETTRTLLTKTQRGFSEGYGSLLDVLEATRALREVEQDQVEANLTLNLAQAARLQATGTLLEAIR